MICFHCMQSSEEDFVQCPQCGKTFDELDIKPHFLKPGTLLNGKYMIGKVMGQGGFGITYVGMDAALELKVAIKEYFPKGFASRDPETQTISIVDDTNSGDYYSKKCRDAFVTEARTLAKFNKEPNVVKVRECFSLNNTAYIIMDFVDGPSLKSYLKASGPVPVEQLMAWFMPLIDVLGRIHEHGLLHRDISPDNLLLENGQLILIDFGASRDYQSKSSLSVVYKRGYAPIEQYMSHGHQGEWTDIYALCATMYHCLTGVKPPESSARMVEDTLKPPSALGISVPPQFEAALMRGLSSRYHERQQSMRELADELCADFTQAIPTSSAARWTYHPTPTPIPKQERENLAAADTEMHGRDAADADATVMQSGLTVANADMDGLTAANTEMSGLTVANTDMDGLTVANTDMDGLTTANPDFEGLTVANTDMAGVTSAAPISPVPPVQTAAPTPNTTQPTGYTTTAAPYVAQPTQEQETPPKSSFIHTGKGKLLIAGVCAVILLSAGGLGISAALRKDKVQQSGENPPTTDTVSTDTSDTTDTISDSTDLPTDGTAPLDDSGYLLSDSTDLTAASVYSDETGIVPVMTDDDGGGDVPSFVPPVVPDVQGNDTPQHTDAGDTPQQTASTQSRQDGSTNGRDTSVTTQTTTKANVKTTTTRQTTTTPKPTTTTTTTRQTPPSPFQTALSGGEVTITGLLQKSLANVVIPSEINGNPVRSIADSAFAGNTTIRTVSFEEGVVSIGSSAFAGCSALTSCSLPSSLRSIGKNAFMNSAVSSLFIPDGIETIGNSAFYGMPNLNAVRLPHTVRVIEAQAFMDCSTLETVCLPLSLQSIGSVAFFSYMPRHLDIYYEGSQNQWEAISGSSNVNSDVDVYYNSY